MSLEGNSTLKISDNLIQRIYDFDYKIHPNQLDSTSKISGNTLINLKTKEQALIKRDGDSILIHIHNIDTLFLMDYDNVVRKFKSYYFLNNRLDKTSWTVKKLQLSKGEIVISSISTKQDLENLKEITETPQDTIQTYKFTATKKQFKEFIRNKGFSDSERFIKLKE